MMRHYYLFQNDDSRVTAVAATAIDSFPISDDLGDALADGGTVSHGITMHLLRKFGGSLIDAEGREAVFAMPQPEHDAG